MLVLSVDEIDKFLGDGAKDYLLELIDTKNLNKYEKGSWKFFLDKNYTKCIILDNSSMDVEIMEFHREYTDIHVTLIGTDKMCIGKVVTETIEPYASDQDYGLVKVAAFEEKSVPKDCFIRLEPGIIHTNILGPDSLKVVFKIKK